MKPLRRKKTIDITDNPVTGQERILGMTEEDNILSDEKSIDVSQLRRIVFLDCGCTTAAFGRCYKCGAISCQVHHGTCQRCLMPICLQCSNILTTENKTRERYCSRCCDIITGKRKLKKIGQFFLSAFFESNNSNGQ